MHIAIKANETNTKTNLLKNARYLCNGKAIITYLSFPNVLYFPLHIYFRPGQEYGKHDQITANKNAGAFVTLSLCVFITTSF